MSADRSLYHRALDPVARCLVLANVPPLIWMYRLGAEALIRIGVRYLTAGDAIKSIYLIRGFARGEEVYGISDIDLLIVVKHEKSVRRVVRRYQLLASLVPLFDRVHGVVSFEKMQALYTQHDICGYRYNLDAGHWKLLYGEEIRDSFGDPVVGPRRDRSLQAELCKLWNTALKNLVFQTLPRHKARYRMHKLHLELQRIMAYDGHGGPRPASPASAASLRATARRYLRDDPVDSDRPLGTWMKDVNRWQRRVFQRYGAITGLPIRTTYRPSELPSSNQLSRYMKVLRKTLTAAGEQGPALVVLPRVLHPTLASLLNPRVDSDDGPAALVHLGIDDCCVYYVPTTELSNDQLQVIASLSPMQSHRRLDLYLAHSHACFCLTNRGPYYDTRPSVQSPLTSPITFHLLAQAIGDDAGHRCPDPVVRWLGQRCTDELALARELLASGLSGLGNPASTKLFYYVMQVHLVLHNLQRGVLDVPLTSRDITSRLHANDTMAASWIQDVQSTHEAYLAGQDYHQQSTRLLLAHALKYAQRRSESWSNGINRIST